MHVTGCMHLTAMGSWACMRAELLSSRGNFNQAWPKVLGPIEMAFWGSHLGVQVLLPQISPDG